MPYMDAVSFFMIYFLMILTAQGSSSSIFDVTNYGAVGDGRTDDTQAFQKAWGATCESLKPPTLLIPGNKVFLLGQINFEGPCKSYIHVQVNGKIVAPNKIWGTKDHWINFMNINGLNINGPGQIDGNGRAWWDCKTKKKCDKVPDTLAVIGCNNIALQGLKFLNSPGKHIAIDECTGVAVSGLTIVAPGDSPNTDGIHFQACQHVQVHDCTIGTGDDCISIGKGNVDLNITRITCGPGHGISIGSLGEKDSWANVEQIDVSFCNFFQTENGARIKTWPGGSGFARGIKFSHLNFTAVDRPIVIDQYYCNGAHNCPNKTSSVQISDVHYIGLQGSSVKEGITLDCSKTVGCKNIILANVNIVSANSGSSATSVCYNAHGLTKGHVNPMVPCLRNI